MLSVFLFFFSPTTLFSATPIASISILALGDSYTIGEGVAQKNSWPFQLAEQLRVSRNFKVLAPRVIARTGWTSADLLQAVSQAKLTARYDVVLLMIGVNDQFQRRSLDDFANDFLALLKRSIQLAGGDAGHVLVVSIPDYSVTPFGQRGDARRTTTEIYGFNRLLKKTARFYHVQLVDVTPLSQLVAGDPDLLCGDGLHPSAKLHGLWAGEMAGKVLGILRVE